MMTLDDVNTIEGGAATEMAYYLSLQRTIDNGMWSLQGSYGRTMMGAIESGHCMLGLIGSRDYWGGRIPSRTDVKEGTKGSRSFVAEHHGEDWAAAMEGA
jgi:hypothetical protein